MKKAMELSILCDCEVTLTINNHGDISRYSSHDKEKITTQIQNYSLFNNEDYPTLCKEAEKNTPREKDPSPKIQPPTPTASINPSAISTQYKPILPISLPTGVVYYALGSNQTQNGLSNQTPIFLIAGDSSQLQQLTQLSQLPVQLQLPPVNSQPLTESLNNYIQVEEDVQEFTADNEPPPSTVSQDEDRAEAPLPLPDENEVIDSEQNPQNMSKGDATEPNSSPKSFKAEKFRQELRPIAIPDLHLSLKKDSPPTPLVNTGPFTPGEFPFYSALGTPQTPTFLHNDQPNFSL